MALAQLRRFFVRACAKNPHLRQRDVTTACPDANHRATEDAMPALRIATAGAALLVLTAGTTIAQPTGTATSKPISILKILAPTDNTRTRPHSHRAGAPTWKSHATAHQKARHLLAVAPAGAVQADVWGDAEATTATQVASDEPEQQGAAAAETEPTALVVGGRPIQVVSPDDANEIDLAADVPEVPATKGPRSDIAEATQPPQVETVAVAQAHEPSPAGTSAWVAQLLAAIGGAMAAASVAWFLIGSAPQRTYD
jgi:hypothetical protein